MASPGLDWSPVPSPHPDSTSVDVRDDIVVLEYDYCHPLLRGLSPTVIVLYRDVILLASLRLL
jgi:hypothetical protein